MRARVQRAAFRTPRRGLAAVHFLRAAGTMSGQKVGAEDMQGWLDKQGQRMKVGARLRLD